ncbi:hypothetical protein PtA15_1A773 [Puccinia triticina]|uniref:Uncharacterized protein n=1 Tax=Puccinia triticina TaxID=208348 RepID=A0ABY7CF27_9BASI|nr:uncharacterized protein PtA15_1A773 [Puccinia triticina]WAQ81432.1 hypothetical protein PtA15_1A773 [Puccinia triticina]
MDLQGDADPTPPLARYRRHYPSPRTPPPDIFLPAYHDHDHLPTRLPEKMGFRKYDPGTKIATVRGASGLHCCKQDSGCRRRLVLQVCRGRLRHFPNAVVFKMIMREPNDPPADSMPADGNSVKRAHPVDADGERRPAIALRTPGAYKSTQQSAVPGIKAFQLGCPTPFKLAPTTGSMHPLWEAGAMAPFRTTSIYSQQSTGSRSVTRAVTKDGHKGMSTPKTSAPKIHEVGPSPLATNTTAPRVPAGCQPVSTDEIEVIRGPLTATALRVVSLPST